MPENALRLAGQHAKPMPRKINFTVAALASIQPPDEPAGRVWVYDCRMTSLAYMMTGGGARSFYMVKRQNGQLRRMRLGGGELSIEQARKLATEMLVNWDSGKDPAAEKRKIQASGTLGTLWEWFLENHAKPRKRSWKTDEYRWKKHLNAWSSRRLVDITRADVQGLMNRIGKEHPTGANRILALLSVMYSKAKMNGYIGENPTEGIERFKESSRERFLGADELPRFLTALDDEQTPADWRDFFKLLLLTGVRRGNLLSAQWSDMALDRGEWRIPDAMSKSGYAMTVSLSAPAVDILKRRQANKSAWVFPSTSKSGHAQDPRNAWDALLKRAKLPDVRLHDLRRSLGSWMAASGASLPVIGKTLGHRTPSVTAVYARLNLDPVKAAVELATTAMLASVATATAKVQ